MSFGERVWGSPPQALVFHRARFETRFPAGSSSSWFSGLTDLMGGKRCGWGLPLIYRGPPLPPSRPARLPAPSPCPCSSAQSRLVESGIGRCEVGIRGAGHCPTAVTLLAWERRAAHLCRQTLGDHCGPAVPPHLRRPAHPSLAPVTPDTGSVGSVLASVIGRAPCVFWAWLPRLQQDCGLCADS